MIARRPDGSPRAAWPLSFSTMRLEDLDSVLEIERVSFPNPWSAEFFLQEFKLPFSRVVLARAPVGSERRLVGYVCRWITEGEVHILNVAVHPEWRRRSIGRRLLEHALEEGRRAGARRALLEVRQRNREALALYESLGFARIGLRRNYYAPGEDALVMELRLPGAAG